MILKTDEFAKRLFKGVMARDIFLSDLQSADNGMYIFNTHNSDQPGEHWLFLNIEGEKCEFFDSYGRSINHFPDVKAILQSTHLAYIDSNRKIIQGTTSNVCGDYCIFLCLTRCRGFSMKECLEILGKGENCEVRDHSIRRSMMSQYEHYPLSLFTNQNLHGVDGVHIQGVISNSY